jgi:hypothetical protein
LRLPQARRNDYGDPSEVAANSNANGPGETVKVLGIGALRPRADAQAPSKLPFYE